MKEFGIGAVIITACCGALVALLMGMAPLAEMSEDRGRAPAGVKMGAPVYLSMGFLAAVVIGTCSSGIGAGVLDAMKRRKK